INERGEVEWIPPPGLDTGQARINYYHRPERLLRPDDEDQDEPDAAGSDPGPDEPGGPAPPGHQAA
ncbi:HNH endonuclease signature motif containing protein, partial [Mycolicibacterium pulveris]